MKIALAQLNYHIGNFADNTRKICATIEQARTQKADLVVFAELAVCGYPPLDFLEFDDFIERCEQAIQEIAGQCQGIAAIVGAPSRNPASSGKPLYNAAYFLAEGSIQAVRYKSLLPTYDVFDEYRYFEPNTHFEPIDYQGIRIALTICEDLWMEGVYPLYTRNPMEELARFSPDLIINIAASPFDHNQAETRLQVMKANVRHYKLPLVYVNHVGAQTELIFDGGSLVLNQRGELLQSPVFFREAITYCDIEKCATVADVTYDGTQRMYQALVLGIQDFFRKLGFSKAVLGLSGGIDSAVVLVLAAHALGAENVLGVLMPSGFSSGHSVDDALQLSHNLGTPYHAISIENTFQSFNADLAPYFTDLAFDVTEENIQARVRAVLLMALSNKLGYILLNTSNKSEAAVGYGTLYGDMCGGLSVLGDVYKTQVYALAGYINREKEVIPQHIIDKPPSAELRPGQKDADSLPDYTILDAILFQYLELKKGPDDLVSMGFDAPTVHRTLRLVNSSEHKRYQTPPILRVSDKAFGMGRRMPIVGKYLI